jgi:hypothetical protein
MDGWGIADPSVGQGARYAFKEELDAWEGMTALTVETSMRGPMSMLKIMKGKTR